MSILKCQEYILNFKDVPIQPDIVLLIRFYLKKVDDRFAKEKRHEHRLYQDETLTAWATMPLFYPRMIQI